MPAHRFGHPRRVPHRLLFVGMLIGVTAIVVCLNVTLLLETAH